MTSVDDHIRFKVRSYQAFCLIAVTVSLFFIEIIAISLGFSFGVGIFHRLFGLIGNDFMAGITGIFFLVVGSKGFFPFGIWRQMLAITHIDVESYRQRLVQSRQIFTTKGA